MSGGATIIGPVLALTGQQQRRIIRHAARREGISPAILWGVYGQETNYGQNEGPSSAGALGPFQLMPGTARGLGVNPLRFRQAARGAARYLAQYKSRGVKGMLAAYNAGPAGDPNNPETRAYVPGVLSHARTWQGGGLGGAVAPSGGGGRGNLGVAVPGGSGASAPPAAEEGISALLEALMPQRQVPSSGGLAPPSFAASAPTPAGYRAPAGGGGPQPKPDLGALMAAIRTVGGDVPSSSSAGSLVPAGGAGGGGTAPPPASGRGRVTVAAGANRPGVPLGRDVLGFVNRVSAIAGRPLTIGTGSAHSRLTVNGTESDHWRGEAADVPLAGRALVRAGQAALIAAGMPAAKARRITGGGFNVGGWQVIFNTDAPGWGNHLDHLHVGRRG